MNQIMKTYIFGHLKPDLDSTVAAISFAKYCELNQVVNPTPVIIDDANNETNFVFDKFAIPLPPKISLADITPEDRIILVDHNEESQRLVGLNPEQIVGIYDHHKVNLNLSHPIELVTLPFGSSNTIAWYLFREFNFTPDQKLSSLMLSAVLSDTVGMKSSTTTQTDRQAITDLATKADIADIDNLTLEIFKAKSDISKLTDEQIVLNDYKIFDFSGQKVLIGQTETVEQDLVLTTRKSGILTALQSIKVRENIGLIFLAITDILKVNTKIILVGDREKSLAEKAFNITSIDQIIDIGAKLSRKKDIAPAIELALK